MLRSHHPPVPKEVLLRRRGGQRSVVPKSLLPPHSHTRWGQSTTESHSRRTPPHTARGSAKAVLFTTLLVPTRTTDRAGPLELSTQSWLAPPTHSTGRLTMPEPYSEGDLAERVHDRMRANGGDHRDAIRGFVEEVAENGELEKWWRGLGYRMVYEVVGIEERNKGRPDLDGNGWERPDNWNEGAKWSGFDIFGLQFPVDGKGTRKRIGHFTGEDWQTRAEMLSAKAKAIQREARLCDAVSQAVPEDVTTAEAWEDLPDPAKQAIYEVADRKADEEAA